MVRGKNSKHSATSGNRAATKAASKAGKQRRGAGERMSKKKSATVSSAGNSKILEAQAKKHEHLVNTLETEIKGLRDRLDSTLPPRSADTLARMSKGQRGAMEKTAERLGVDATSRRYASLPGAGVGAGSSVGASKRGSRGGSKRGKKKGKQKALVSSSLEVSRCALDARHFLSLHSLEYRTS